MILLAVLVVLAVIVLTSGMFLIGYCTGYEAGCRDTEGMIESSEGLRLVTHKAYDGYDLGV